LVRQPVQQRLEVRIEVSSRKLTTDDCDVLRSQIIRMLRLQDADQVVAKHFMAQNKDLANRGPVGRLFRSASLFEDLVKTFTLCNCGWGRTMSMNAALCKHIGNGPFPSPAQLARVSAKKLRRRCGVGYRAERIIRLAKLMCSENNSLNRIEHMNSSSAVSDHLCDIYGLGPFGVANALQLLGHYQDIPADSETVRHLCQARGLRSCTLKNVSQKAAAIYSKFAPYQFLRYWTELWQTYEDRMGGPAHKVHPDKYALLTSSQLRVRRQPYSFKKRPLHHTSSQALPSKKHCAQKR